MTESSPIISVCVANFNGMEVIDDCLRSVLEQEGHIPVEILVHDDASSDGSAAYIRSRYPDVKLIESSENVGFCVANNRMVAAAKGKYLLLLNNDAALYPDALQTLLIEAERLDQPAILGLPQFDAETGELLDIGSLLDPFLNPVPNMNPHRGEVGLVMGACLWMSTTLWDELGGFPEWFGSIGEDLYLCCRARLAGHSVRVVADSGFRHWVGQSFGGGKVTTEQRLVTTLKRRTLTERNKTYTLIITYPTLLFAFLFPLHLILLHLEGLLLAVLKRNISLWHIIYAPLLPTLWGERRHLFALRKLVQSSRKITLAHFLGPFRCWPWKLEMLWRHGLPEVRHN